MRIQYYTWSCCVYKIVAMFLQGNTLMLDQFIKDISELVKSESTPATKSPPSSSSQYGAFKKLDPLPAIPLRAVQQFKNKAISTVEFAKLLESRLSSTAASHFIELNCDVLQRICWKWVYTYNCAQIDTAILNMNFNPIKSLVKV